MMARNITQDGSGKDSSSIPVARHKNGGTKLDRGSFALVVTASNELQLYLPATSHEDAVFPQNALALIAVANKLKDVEWVEQLLIDEFGPR
jgi:hypothetical protein